jgi:hypothetical protein
MVDPSGMVQQLVLFFAPSSFDAVHGSAKAKWGKGVENPPEGSPQRILRDLGLEKLIVTWTTPGATATLSDRSARQGLSSLSIWTKAYSNARTRAKLIDF